jgi:hypothetical protein
VQLEKEAFPLRNQRQFQDVRIYIEDRTKYYAAADRGDCKIWQFSGTLKWTGVLNETEDGDASTGNPRNR